MIQLLSVMFGGAVGAGARYLISLIPLKTDFPLLTLLTNLLGAVLIGAIVGLNAGGGKLPANAVLFFKTGLCGGFTTFSTFSLEALTLLERGKTAAGCLYIAASLLLCLAGVAAGRALALRLLR